MEFVENKGQWNPKVNFKGAFNSGSFFLEQGGFTVLLHKTADLEAISEMGHSTFKPITLHSFAYKVRMLNARISSKPIPEKPFSTYNNYFLGDDPSKWAGDCKIYQAVTYKEIYPNIDVRYYSENNRLKYDFIVRPGGNVNDIALEYDGPQISVKDKELIVKTPLGDIRELYPYSYQTGTGKRTEVEARYIVKNNIVTFNVRNYDQKNVLIIDPTIIFSTFTKSTGDNWGYTATPGPDGTLYAGGIVFAEPPSLTYPVSAGAYQTTYGGGVTDDTPGHDIALFKFSADGSNRVYATYLGGSGNEQPHSLIVDRNGNLIVAGRSTSGNYPSTNSLGPRGRADVVITKFTPSGSALIGSVKIGGSEDDGVNITPKYRYQGDTSIRVNYGDDARSEVILDGNGNIILASCTQSTNFPTVGPSLNPGGGSAGRQDGLILSFNSSLTSYLYGSYFGGSANDACFVTSFSPTTGYLYVGGATGSSNLPGDKSGVYQSTYQGSNADGFVTKIKLDSGIVRTTYTGTSGEDLVYGLKFDRFGFPYIMGTTTGNWPVQGAVFSNPNSAQFIAKLSPNLNSFVYSTVFGDGVRLPNISPIGFLVDRCENVYVTGWGGGLNNAQNYGMGNTSGLPEVNPLAGIPNKDGGDFYFFVLQRDATAQLFGSHFGQNGGMGDHVDGGTSRFDNNGVIYQAICANCGRVSNQPIPTTPSAWSRENGSQQCNQVLVKIRMDFAGVGAGLQASIDGVANDTIGCVPFEVIFSDTLQQGNMYYWNFGDGSPQEATTSLNVPHTYTVPGNYLVQLISEDLNTCNQRDTAYVTIKAGNNAANLSWRAVKDTPCTSLSYTLINTSTSTFATPGFNSQSFTWTFGDGSAPQVSLNATHTFPAPGVYEVTLTLNDTSFCNSPLVLKDSLRVFPLVNAAFSTSPLGCAPYTAQFNFTGGGAGTDFFWSFGDGTFSTDSSDAYPTHYYASPGVYPVRLIVRDTNTCNKIDTSAYFNITVLPKPVPAFTWSPNPPQRNTATQFTNLSTGAVRYLWDFGEEGATSTEVNPRYQFNSTGSFKVSLTAYNQNNCDSTITRMVDAIIDPLLDVPNAFTPGRFGINGLVSVKGYGINKMEWRIYNRWGQLIFSTNSRKQSWDGTYNGKPQPMDVYAYTLDVVFTDGKTLRKTGDITLIR